MSHRPSRRSIAVAVLALLGSLGVGGALTAQAAPTSTAQTYTVLVGSQSPHMAVQGMQFLPGDVTIDAGDTVLWKANSAEPHTVTFFKDGAPQASLPEFNPGDPMANTKQGGNTFEPDTYYNSGILNNVAAGADFGPFPPGVTHSPSYSLTFPNAGTFTYYCLVHGMMMRGVVHVQPAGAAYPYTQDEVTADAQWQARAINRDGAVLRLQALAATTAHRVIMGADDGHAMVMRFYHHRVVIHRGQKVHFVNTMGMGPHTVTFGQEPQGLALFAPSGHPMNYRGGSLNSGIMPPMARFTVTFNKVGTYHYVCALHDFMGMVGTVVVRR
jgi:plastocyanin